MEVQHSNPIYFSGSFFFLFISTPTILNSIFTGISFFKSRTFSYHAWAMGSFFTCLCDFILTQRSTDTVQSVFALSLYLSVALADPHQLLGADCCDFCLSLAVLSKPLVLFLGRLGFIRYGKTKPSVAVG